VNTPFFAGRVSDTRPAGDPGRPALGVTGTTTTDVWPAAALAIGLGTLLLALLRMLRWRFRR
jgi:hypothetical protein